MLAKYCRFPCMVKAFLAITVSCTLGRCHDGKPPLSGRQSALVSTPTVPRLVGLRAVDRAEEPMDFLSVQLHIHTPSSFVGLTWLDLVSIFF